MSEPTGPILGSTISIDPMFMSLDPTAVLHLREIPNGKSLDFRTRHEGRANLLLTLDDIPVGTVVSITVTRP